MIEATLMWTWRDSNPRPNEETIRFLHAYLCLSFRIETEPKPSISTLSSKVSRESRGGTLTISDITVPPVRIASEQQLPGDISSPHLMQR